MSCRTSTYSEYLKTYPVGLHCAFTQTNACAWSCSCAALHSACTGCMYSPVLCVYRPHAQPCIAIDAMHKKGRWWVGGKMYGRWVGGNGPILECEGPRIWTPLLSMVGWEGAGRGIKPRGDGYWWKKSWGRVNEGGVGGRGGRGPRSRLKWGVAFERF